MRSCSVVSALTIAGLSVLFAVVSTGCDQLNKPLGSPKRSSPVFGDGGAESESGVAGSEDGEGEIAPAPTITAHPDDIRL